MKTKQAIDTQSSSYLLGYARVAISVVIESLGRSSDPISRLNVSTLKKALEKLEQLERSSQ